MSESEAPKRAAYDELPEETNWTLPKDKINRLQQASMARLIDRCRRAHFTNLWLQVRINGDWEVYQADWLKHMKPADDAYAERITKAATGVCWYDWGDAVAAVEALRAALASNPHPTPAPVASTVENQSEKGSVFQTKRATDRASPRVFHTKANAERLLAFRNAHCTEDFEEAWNAIYWLISDNAADPFHPWRELEELAPETLLPPDTYPPQEQSSQYPDPPCSECKGKGYVHRCISQGVAQFPCPACGGGKPHEIRQFPPRGPDTCACADPENCTEPVPGCRAGHAID